MDNREFTNKLNEVNAILMDALHAIAELNEMAHIQVSARQDRAQVDAPVASESCGSLFEQDDIEAVHDGGEKRRVMHRYAPKDNRKKFITTQRVKQEMGCDIKVLKQALKEANIVSFYPYEGSQQKHILRYQTPILKNAITKILNSR